MLKLKDKLKQTIIYLHKYSTETVKKHPDIVAKWILINYIFIKLKKLLKVKLTHLCLPDQFLHNSIKKQCINMDKYIDYNTCIYVSCKYISSPDWYFICSISTQRIYKVYAIPLNQIPEDIVYLSETMFFNINNNLRVSEQSYMFYFLFPEKKQVEFAKKACVSQINSTQNYSNELIYIMLQNYFSHPRFLRESDVFKIDIKEFASEYFYTNEYPSLSTLYFKVNSIDDNNNNGKYILKDETQLTQKGNINSYIPKQLFLKPRNDDLIDYEAILHLKNNYAPYLETYLQELDSSIAPFLQKDFVMNIRPIFIVQGSQGSGKFVLIQSLAQRRGLHFLHVNLFEFRTMATAQKEAKIKMILKNAINCTPCILMLRNIEIIGMNSEGEKDERALAAFNAEINDIYEKELEFPMILIVTSEAQNIPVELKINFIDIITISHMSRDERQDMLKWLLETNGIKYNADLVLIAGKCSGFGFTDLEALIFHAVKNNYKLLSEEEKTVGVTSITLTNDDFNSAYEWMQQIFSDEIGAPRIPKVYWEDIGGLVEIKQEIMKRIALPTLMSSGEKSGLLLFGPPGTGKTLLAKAVATEYQFHFLSVKGPELLNKYVGQSEDNIRQIFEKARAAAPCILFFDELDSLAPNRGRSGDSGGVMDSVVSQLLTELDGIESNNYMVIIGATNRPDLIDPALLRPGRFDKMLYVGLYNEKNSQKSVLKALTRKFNLEQNGEELDHLLDFLPANLTGADLYAICSEAWLMATRKFIQNNEVDLENKEFKSDPVVVTLDDFKHALSEFKPSVSEEEMKKYKMLKDKLS